MNANEPAHSSHAARFRARIVGALIALALFVVFVVENSRTVRIRFLVFEADTRLAWALVMAGAFGALFGLLFPRVRRLL